MTSRLPTRAAIGVPVGHRLADRRQVGGHAVALAGAAHRDAKAGADLVEDQHGAVLVRELLDGLEVARRRRDHRLGHRVPHRGDDHAGDPAVVLREDAFQVGEVAVLELLGELPYRLRHAAVIFDAPVAPAVVATTRDHVAAGVGARRAHGRVGGVGAGLHEDRLLAARHDVGQPLLELVLQRLDEAEAEAFVHLRLGGVVDLGLHVPEDDRAVGAQHVDVLVAVDVEDVPALAVRDEDGVFADDEVVRTADAAHAARRKSIGVLQHRHRLRQVELGGALHSCHDGSSFRERVFVTIIRGMTGHLTQDPASRRRMAAARVGQGRRMRFTPPPPRRCRRPPRGRRR